MCSANKNQFKVHTNSVPKIKEANVKCQLTQALNVQFSSAETTAKTKTTAHLNASQ